MGRLGLEVANGSGRMKLNEWTKGTGLVYRMCFLAHA